MIEIAEFRPEEINEAITSMDGLRNMIAPVLRSINKDGMGEQDVQQFVRHLTLAKHALIATGNLLEGQMVPNNQLTTEELWEMDGAPVWNDTMKKWVIVDLFWEHGPRTVDARGRWRDLEDRYYRRKP